MQEGCHVYFVSNILPNFINLETMSTDEQAAIMHGRNSNMSHFFKMSQCLKLKRPQPMTVVKNEQEMCPIQRQVKIFEFPFQPQCGQIFKFYFSQCKIYILEYRYFRYFHLYLLNSRLLRLLTTTAWWRPTTWPLLCPSSKWATRPSSPPTRSCSPTAGHVWTRQLRPDTSKSWDRYRAGHLTRLASLTTQCCCSCVSCCYSTLSQCCWRKMKLSKKFSWNIQPCFKDT